MEYDMIEESLRKICAFWGRGKDVRPADWYSTKIALPPINEDLARIREWLAGLCDKDWKIHVGSGWGAVSEILYITMLPPEQTSSDGLYVAICFGKAGNGLVSGSAVSCTSHGTNPLLNDIPTEQRAKDGGHVPTINVDGRKPNVRYNNHFINPQEMLVDEIDIARLTEHLRTSIWICKAGLAYIRSVAANREC